MGISRFEILYKTVTCLRKKEECLDAAKEAKSRTSQNHAHLELGFNFLLEGSIAYFAKATTLNELEQVPPFIWQPSWNTWQLKSWSLLAMLLGITRKRGSSQDICS